MSDHDQLLLEMRGMRKSFAGVDALKGVDLTLHAGECLAVCGENGAGKSTLIKLLGGVYRADAGEIFIDEQSADIRNPQAATDQGIAIIHQEFNLVPHLTARENIVLGQEKTRFGFPSARAEADEARALFQRIGVDIDPEEHCANLTIAQQQAVEIAKALHIQARIIVMDEPSATLTDRETKRLFAIIRELKSQGLGIIYISHRMEEIFEVAERVMVLRDGEHVATNDTKSITREQLIESMVGRVLKAGFPTRSVELGEEVLRVEGLRRGKWVQDVSFSVRAGEILGFAGLVGAGRTETVRLVFGADRPESGQIYLSGDRVSVSGPRDAIAQGICLLTEDRRGQGLIVSHSIIDNFGLPNLDLFARGPFVNTQKESKQFNEYVGSLQIKIASPDQHASTLSGGNQQKIVLAKWLERNSQIIIFDEPTRGIDVGAKYEIYRLMNKLASEGKAIIMISSELPEVLGMSDRILVMHEGQVKGEISEVKEATQEQIMSMILGPQPAGSPA